jgi:type IV pilus assembly protein PilB
MNILSEDIQQKIEESLINNGLLSVEQINEAHQKAKASSKPFLSVLVDDGYVDNEQLTKYSALANGLPYVNLKDAYIDQKYLDLLPKDIAEHYMAVPIGEMGNRMAVAMLDASNLQAIDFLSNKIGKPLKTYIASEEGIINVLKQYKIKIDDQVVSEEAENSPEQTRSSLDIGSTSKTIKSIVQDSPVSIALNNILEYAVSNLASDVHIEPYEKELKIRIRIDGVLREIMKLPKSTEPAIVSRIKILSNLKIDEHRIPQDGEFSVNLKNRNVDLRISISPVVWGEQIVMRLLDKTAIILKLEDMGYRGRSLYYVRKGLKSSNGMILTSGPTGSGKSTSMYAMLQEVKNDTVNIVTLEDPVEYKMDGINQIQVNNDVGLTFTTGLRSILRQDPDIVMVGEIRDKETAELAVQAALTGHLVFSTLHTNSAAGILPRLLDMGIEPFLIASTIRVVIGQRLVRRVADENIKYSSSPTETAAILNTVGRLLPKTHEDISKYEKALDYNLPLVNQKEYTLVKGKDSPGSPGGYRGRIGIFEAFEITPNIQNLILERATSSQIEQIARKEGMVTMREDGYLKALSGLTTIQEIDRVSSGEFD